MPKVLNKYKDSKIITDNDIYIGRPSKWGNQFVLGKDGNREEVIAKYRDWMVNNPTLLKQARQELKGKNLVCFCAPKPCHGDVLIDLESVP